MDRFIQTSQSFQGIRETKMTGKTTSSNLLYSVNLFKMISDFISKKRSITDILQTYPHEKEEK